MNLLAPDTGRDGSIVGTPGMVLVKMAEIERPALHLGFLAQVRRVALEIETGTAPSPSGDGEPNPR